MRGHEYADLCAFVTVVEHGSFSKAAHQLRISASTLSQMIRQLEERMGVRLLNRTTRSLSLTEAGSHVLTRFKPAMLEILALEQSVRTFRDTPSGTVRLHAPRLAVAAFIEPALGSFHEAYPEITLDVTVEDAVVDIVKAGFDLGIRLGEFLQNDMVALKLGGNLRQIAVASPAYFARHGRPNNPTDLLTHHCINWRQPGTPNFYEWEFEKDGRVLKVAVDGALAVSHRDLAVSAAVQGVGIALWEEEYVRPFIERGQLVQVLDDWSPFFPGWHLYYPKQRLTPPAVRAFVTFLRNFPTPE